MKKIIVFLLFFYFLYFNSYAIESCDGPPCIWGNWITGNIKDAAIRDLSSGWQYTQCYVETHYSYRTGTCAGENVYEIRIDNVWFHRNQDCQGISLERKMRQAFRNAMTDAIQRYNLPRPCTLTVRIRSCFQIDLYNAKYTRGRPCPGFDNIECCVHKYIIIDNYIDPGFLEPNKAPFKVNFVELINQPDNQCPTDPPDPITCEYICQSYLSFEEGFLPYIVISDINESEEIKDITEGSVIYPNPANNEIKIIIPQNNDKDIHLKVFNCLSELIASEKYQIERHNFICYNISSLAAGHYYYRLSIGEQQFYGRFCKF
jgi:hypothetical protein